MLDTDMADWESKNGPAAAMHLMEDGSWMKDEAMMHKMPNGEMMRDIDMPEYEAKNAPAPNMHLMADGQWMKNKEMERGEQGITGAGLLATTEDIGAHSKEGMHKMPDGSWMRDEEMADWESKNSPAAAMHLMEDGSWMKDEA